MTERTQIYVKVISASGEAWRPADALRLPEDVYEIVTVRHEAGEKPQFAPGRRVRCRPYELTDHDLILVAHEPADSSTHPDKEKDS